MASFNQIVQTNISVQVAPAPTSYLNTAAIVSIGGTTLAAGTTRYISASGQLESILQSELAVSTATWSSGIVTLVTSAHGIPVGTTTTINVSGCTPAGYNGTFVATAATTTEFTYAVATNPGTLTGSGTVETGPTLYLEAADATWWAQGNSQVGYYVYEAGTAASAAVLTSVQTYLAANPQTIYNWGFLPGIDSDATDAEAFFTLYNSYQSLQKFYLPVTAATYATWATQSQLLNVFAFIQSPGANANTELDSVSFMQYMTAFKPSASNKLPPSQYRYLSGVTAYAPLTSTLTNAFLSGNINFVTTGAEGGISNTIIVAGKNLNGTPANVAYSIDWVQVNINLAVSNAVINGSNNTLNPLYYNQDGINSLQQVAATVGNQAVQSGLALGQVITTSLDPVTFISNIDAGLYAGNFVINAIPFNTYVAENPADYANQLYAGFQVAYTPQYGFQTIVFNILVTQFA